MSYVPSGRNRKGMMLKINPYNRRRAVTAPAEFKGHRELLAQLVGGLPQNYNIYGGPQTGKSSLLHFLSHPEVSQAGAATAPRPKGWLPVFIDLKFLPERSDLSFWRYLFDSLTEKCRAADLESDAMRRVAEEAKATRELYDIQKTVLAYTGNLGRDVVILLDNFDVVIEEFPEDEALMTIPKL